MRFITTYFYLVKLIYYTYLTNKKVNLVELIIIIRYFNENCIKVGC